MTIYFSYFHHFSTNDWQNDLIFITVKQLNGRQVYNQFIHPNIHI
jgi:hypothetical protein